MAIINVIIIYYNIFKKEKGDKNGEGVSLLWTTTISEF
jgi:hypothetical protein